MVLWLYGFGGSEQGWDGLVWMDHTPLTVTTTRAHAVLMKYKQYTYKKESSNISLSIYCCVSNLVVHC